MKRILTGTVFGLALSILAGSHSSAMENAGSAVIKASTTESALAPVEKKNENDQ